jgi:hypothetical protein
MNEKCKANQCVVQEACGSEQLCNSDTEICFGDMCENTNSLTECGNTYCFKEEDYCLSADEGCVKKSEYFECGSTYCVTATDACKDSTSCVLIDDQCAAGNSAICSDKSKYDYSLVDQGIDNVKQASAQGLCGEICRGSGGIAIGPSLVMIVTAALVSFLFTAEAIF